MVYNNIFCARVVYKKKESGMFQLVSCSQNEKSIAEFSPASLRDSFKRRFPLAITVLTRSTTKLVERRGTENEKKRNGDDQRAAYRYSQQPAAEYHRTGYARVS